MSETGTDARSDWEARIGRHRDVREYRPPGLAAPTGVRAEAGRGQVTVDWDPVGGAVGYRVERAEERSGPFEAIEIGEPLVRAVPHPPLTDTTGTPGRLAWYRVAAVGAVDDHGQPVSEAVAATPRPDGADEADGLVHLEVLADRTLSELHRPWRPMIGAEHLSQLEHGTGPGDRHIGEEFAAALRLAHSELGVRAVRAHAIFLDELGVYREEDGEPVHDFSGVDRIYDQVRELGLRPIVELGFMPRDLARDPEATVFDYRAIISPPHDWGRWGELVRALTAHLVDRYGLEEVRSWGFEVWNEANLEVFWAGTPAEYLRLYDVSVAAVKSVDPELPVGGPASAAAGWLDLFLEHAQRTEAPVDFLSTHTYGNAPLDLRPLAARHGFPGLPQWWTEWGAHATHFNDVHDSVWSAAYLVRGMASAMHRIEALAYWTVSDHFEELGRPPQLFHGGFGLLSVGNLRKPRWWGLWMLAQLGDTRLDARLAGDGAGDMVDAVATRTESGDVRIVLWNGTVDVSKAGGDELLRREVELAVEGLAAGSYQLRHRRLDAEHSDITRAWAEIGSGEAWPDETGWEALRAADQLTDLYAPHRVQTDGGAVRLTVDLPMPAVSLIELVRETG